MSSLRDRFALLLSLTRADLSARKYSESGRVLLVEAKQGPLVITIAASDPATFAAFAVRADKVLATVKFLP